MSILWPMVFPVAVFVAIEVYLAAGNVLYAHGPSMYLLLISALVGAVVVPWELFALVRGTAHLSKYPQLRSRLNVLSLAAAACYVFGAVIWVLGAQGSAR